MLALKPNLRLPAQRHGTARLLRIWGESDWLRKKKFELYTCEVVITSVT